ncbi:MAG: SBBP repeat-containing protein [Acidobacteria bacterium]|nr:SBBP repeat-containing protein [Acidobacteriota bacterium]
MDAFVAKFGAGGSLIYATLLGGPLDQDGRAIAVDAAGNAYVTGKIWGPNLYPISKLNASGSAVIFSTFDKNARGNAIALDKDLNVWVTGETRDPIPLEKPLQGEFGGGFNDAFVVKLAQTPEERN